MVSMTYLGVVALHDGAHGRLVGVRPPEDTGVVQQADLPACVGIHRQFLGDDDGDDDKHADCDYGDDDDDDDDDDAIMMLMTMIMLLMMMMIIISIMI